MTYDGELADSIRRALADIDVREVSMFGGCSFMVGGKITVVAASDGNMMLRVDPARAENLLGRPGATRPIMRARQMSAGWISINRSCVSTDEAVAAWVRQAVPDMGADPHPWKPGD
ncbi:hypothetical protein BH23ACT6_BH23ACT6_07050 [soil metagenome]